MKSGRRRGLSSVLSSLSLLCVVLDLQLDGEISLFIYTWHLSYCFKGSNFSGFFSCLGSTIVLPCVMTRIMVLMWYSLKYHLKSLYRNMVTIKSISEYHDSISWHYNSTMVPPQVHNRKCQGRSLSNSIKSYWLLKLSKMPIYTAFWYPSTLSRLTAQ